jgi:hypothetical protein
MDKKKACNPFQRLRLQLGVNELLTMKMLKWFELAKIWMVQVLRFIEHEWCFSTLVFMKIKVRN